MASGQVGEKGKEDAVLCKEEEKGASRFLVSGQVKGKGKEEDISSS